jgi:uncharacterized tellurite resistance protein B-like protein
MRRYPRNSPQAAARIVALTVLADGDIGESEIELLDLLKVHTQLGLERSELHAVLDTFCEDLLSSMQLAFADACPVDERTLARLMADIDDPDLRVKLLRLCVDLAESDAEVAEGELIVLNSAVEHWGLQYEMLRSPKDELRAWPD